MTDTLRILLVIFASLLLILVLNLMSKNKIPIRYSLFWIIASLLILIVGAFPDFVGSFTEMVGFQATSNLVIAIILVLLLTITLILTIIVSGHKRKIKLLIQELSIIKSKLDKTNKD